MCAVIGLAAFWLGGALGLLVASLLAVAAREAPEPGGERP